MMVNLLRMGWASSHLQALEIEPSGARWIPLRCIVSAQIT
jgi:hypothetical protein